MLTINHDYIFLTRGDTAKITIGIIVNGETYTPQVGDTIRFAMKKSFHSSELLLVKDIPWDTLLLHIDPEDTKNMQFGEYVYDIEITFENGDVSTFISGVFEIGHEVL